MLQTIKYSERNEEYIKEFFNKNKNSIVYIKTNIKLVQKDLRSLTDYKELRDMLYNKFTRN